MEISLLDVNLARRFNLIPVDCVIQVKSNTRNNATFDKGKLRNRLKRERWWWFWFPYDTHASVRTEIAFQRKRSTRLGVAAHFRRRPGRFAGASLDDQRHSSLRFQDDLAGRHLQLEARLVDGEVVATQQRGQHDFDLEVAVFLADAISRSGAERHVGVRVATGAVLRPESFRPEAIGFRVHHRVVMHGVEEQGYWGAGRDRVVAWKKNQHWWVFLSPQNIDYVIA